MPERRSEAVWEGDLQRGHGRIKLGARGYEGPYSFVSRFGDGEGTNPEELLGAAHAGCFSMALAAGLTAAGHPPRRIRTTAKVFLEKTNDAYHIPRIELETQAEVPGIEAGDFQDKAETAKRNCPVSQLFRGTEITLHAKLVEEHQRQPLAATTDY